VTTSLEKPDEIQAGTAVGEYVITRKIGQGGMGAVYAAEHPLIGKQVAVKILSHELSQDPGIAQRLLEEARAVNRIRHPNIIDIFAFGTLPDGRPYYVMELLDGENLESALQHATLSRTDLAALIDQLCQTLAAAHEAGFVHRDLKPENLWVSRPPDHQVALKVLDFGIAKNIRMTSPALTSNGQVLGTVHYMAPEQALSRAVDARTDIYAVGVMLYRIFAGELPFDDPSFYAVVTKHLTEQPLPISKHREVPKDLEGVVMRCLAKEPAQRPASASQLWTELRPGIEAWRASDQSATATAGGNGTKPALALPATQLAPVAEAPKVDSRATIQAIAPSSPPAQQARPGGRKRALPISVAVATALAGLLAVYGITSRGTANGPGRAQTPASATMANAALTIPASPAAADAGLPASPSVTRDAGSTARPDARPSGRPRPSPKKLIHDNANPIRL
jgi:eukaryotic-like serine/threonine-protein kinase